MRTAQMLRMSGVLVAAPPVPATVVATAAWTAGEPLSPWTEGDPIYRDPRSRYNEGGQFVRHLMEVLDDVDEVGCLWSMSHCLDCFVGWNDESTECWICGKPGVL